MCGAYKCMHTSTTHSLCARPRQVATTTWFLFVPHHHNHHHHYHKQHTACSHGSTHSLERAFWRAHSLNPFASSLWAKAQLWNKLPLKLVPTPPDQKRQLDLLHVDSFKLQCATLVTHTHTESVTSVVVEQNKQTQSSFLTPSSLLHKLLYGSWP